MDITYIDRTLAGLTDDQLAALDKILKHLGAVALRADTTKPIGEWCIGQLIELRAERANRDTITAHIDANLFDALDAWTDDPDD